MEYQWKEKYSVKNKIIDDQHKCIFNILDQLENSSIIDDEKHLNDILECSLEDIQKHFTYEENLMRKNKLPDELLVSHIVEHIYFVKKIKRLENKLYIY